VAWKSFLWLSAIAWLVLLIGVVPDRGRAQDMAPVGMFEGHGDVGTVLHPGSVEYNASKGTYTIAGSGENMWLSTDDFQFVWKKMSGDVMLTADISFVGAGGNTARPC
jgi:TolB protein